MIIRRREAEDGKRATVKLGTRRVGRIKVQQRGNGEFITLDPKLAGKVDSGVDDKSTICSRTEPRGVVCILDGPCIRLELAVKELVEVGVMFDIRVEEFIEGELVGIDKGLDVLDALWGIIDMPLTDALFTEEVLDVFTTLEQFDLFLSTKEKVHAESGIDGHTLEELFASLSVDDIVSDMVFIGEVLELRHDFVEERDRAVGWGVNALCHIASAVGRMGVSDKAGEAFSDVVVVGARQTRLCREVLDGFGDLMELQVHGDGGDVAVDMICRLSTPISPAKQIMVITIVFTSLD